MKLAAVVVLVLAELLFAPAFARGVAEDSADLAELLRKAEGGDVHSQTLVGMAYWYGEQGQKDYAKAHHWLSLAAEDDDPLALFYLAAMYEQGAYVATDTARARHLYARSSTGLAERAEARDPAAMANLGLLYNVGYGVRADCDSAAYWVQRAAETGYARAQYYTGFYFFHGVGSEQDYALAAVWLERAARGGYAPARALLGNMLYNAWGISQDTEKAKEWFLLAEAHAPATETIQDGVYYYNGIPQEGDEIIPGLLPPRFRVSIPEGDCGEACLWTLLRAWGRETAEIRINEDGGAPGRGLHSYELHRVLDEYGLGYRDTMGRPPIAYLAPLIKSFFREALSSPEDLQRYREFLYDEVIAAVKRGTPVILGVKIYPDKNTLDPLDHFILVVGCNDATDVIIFNSHNERGRIRAGKLLDRSRGYSLINRYGATSAIFVPLPRDRKEASRD